MLDHNTRRRLEDASANPLGLATVNTRDLSVLLRSHLELAERVRVLNMTPLNPLKTSPTLTRVLLLL